MIDLDAATVLLQWSTGSLFFLWLTGKRREVGIGYGWTIRITFGIVLGGSIFAGFAQGELLLREIFSIGMLAAVVGAMIVSVIRRKAGVANQRRTEEQRTARVAAMTGIDNIKPPMMARFHFNINMPCGVSVCKPIPLLSAGAVSI